MDVNELKSISADLQSFTSQELSELKTVTGANAVSLKTVASVVSAVVKKLDEVKKKFTSLTDIELHDLAVEAVLELLLFALSSRMGGVGKWLFLMVPLSAKRAIAGVIVDLVVSLLHKKPEPAI